MIKALGYSNPLKVLLNALAESGSLQRLRISDALAAILSRLLWFKKHNQYVIGWALAEAAGTSPTLAYEILDILKSEQLVDAGQTTMRRGRESVEYILNSQGQDVVIELLNHYFSQKESKGRTQEVRKSVPRTSP